MKWTNPPSPIVMTPKQVAPNCEQAIAVLSLT
jgi:hypothetical protein